MWSLRESIPFQDAMARVGRLIMFKECLKYNIVPFIIEDNLKMFYYRGLKEWNNEKGYLQIPVWQHRINIKLFGIILGLNIKQETGCSYVSRKNWQFELEEYIKQGEPDQIEKSEAWQTAIGLQAVDGLKTSAYLLDTAKEHIEGKISIDEA